MVSQHRTPRGLCTTLQHSSTPYHYPGDHPHHKPSCNTAGEINTLTTPGTKGKWAAQFYDRKKYSGMKRQLQAEQLVKAGSRLAQLLNWVRQYYPGSDQQVLDEAL